MSADSGRQISRGGALRLAGERTSTPITGMVFNSLITSRRRRQDEARQSHGQGSRLGCRLWYLQCRGLDRRRQDLVLGNDLRRYAFRPRSFELNAKRGNNTVMANATNSIGQTQVATLIWNLAGYHNNVMRNITLVAG
jgi:hypothetical protein